jgi:hypothetical protein
MKFRAYVVLVVVLWLVSLVVVGVLAQGQQPQPMVISGNDIGFRPDAVQRGKRVMGTWVVRINGQWLETQSAPRDVPLSR